MNQSSSVITIILLITGLASCSTNAGYPIIPPTWQAIESPTAAPEPTAAATRITFPTPTSLPPETSVRSPTPTFLSCWSQGGRILQDSVDTVSLAQPLEYRVYLPPCYDQQPERHYPVLYLLHGQGYADDQWDRIGVDETADRLIGSRQAPPFIIVMPRERVAELPANNKFHLAVSDELVPEIDEKYRTIPERDKRSIGGLSRGAGWAVLIGITHWDLFAAIGAHSPAINNETMLMSSLLGKVPQNKLPRIYIDTGDRDSPTIIDSATWFADLLDKKGFPHEWHLFTGSHDETYWIDHIEGYLLWYSMDW